MAARSKAWTVFARLNTGIVGSNPTWVMDVCLCAFILFVLSCVEGSGLARGPTDWVKYQETEIAAKAQHRGCRAIDK
jgi:hypothetical protein